jgi:hypothetical protein
MKKKILRIIVILLAALQALWISLLLPGQSVEATTGQPPAPVQQSIFKQGSSETLGVGKSFFMSNVFATIQVDPISYLKVQTAPPVAGVHFKLGELSFESGQDGSVTLPMSNGENYSLAVDPTPATTDNALYKFNCWSDGNNAAERVISISDNKVIQVGFNVYAKVGMTFKDSGGNPVDPARVTSITINSTLGDSYSFPDGQPRWLLASVINRQANGLELSGIQYSVMSVVVDGTNVVDQSEQVFDARPGDIWPIIMGLYSVHITARDAIFQNPVGSGVALEYPNGLLETIPFSGEKDVTISSLAPGSYHVQVTGVSGISSYTPIELSQDQEVDLLLPTPLDIVTAFAAGILFASVILLMGRSWLRRSRRIDPVVSQTAGDSQRGEYS